MRDFGIFDGYFWQAKKKAVGVLEIYKDTIRFKVRNLKTVRPFEIREVKLGTQFGLELREIGRRFCEILAHI